MFKQVIFFLLLHEHCDPCTNHFLCFFSYGPPLDNQNMWQLICFDPSLDNYLSHLMIIHGFLFFLFLPDNPESPTFVTPELPPRTEHLVRSSTPKSFIQKVRVTHPPNTCSRLLPPSHRARRKSTFTMKLSSILLILTLRLKSMFPSFFSSFLTQIIILYAFF